MQVAGDERKPFTVTVHSRDRKSGTADAYTVELPARPTGMYSGTVTYLGGAPYAPRTLQMAWQSSGVHNIASADRQPEYIDVLVYKDEVEATGKLYFHDCPSQLSVKHLEGSDAGAAVTNDAEEHLIRIDMVPM